MSTVSRNVLSHEARQPSRSSENDDLSESAQGLSRPSNDEVHLEDNTQSLAYLDHLYQEYLKSPSSLPNEWRDYFKGLDQGETDLTAQYAQPFPRRSIFNPPSAKMVAQNKRMEVAGLQERLDQLIRNFRVRGHILAEVDPLGKKRQSPPELKPEFYGFTEKDFDREFSTTWFGGPDRRTLREMIHWLKTTYCRSIGAQFMHIDSLTVRNWLQERMESTGNRLKLNRDEQIRILKRLSDAMIFENFVQTKFVGQKSFSLEGAEGLIPLLDMCIEKASADGVQEIVFGMAHRGRLNVLANILSKSPRYIFREFFDADPELYHGRGDVKYHLGYSHNWTTAAGKKVHLSLCFNPSHLEFINTVALGRMRSKMDRVHDHNHTKGLTVLIHGDAAFAGEGIVQETLNLSELPGYQTGGTIHVIINNQIGFTTSENEARSTTYATDVAKMLQIPIFHVNGEDPEAVTHVVRLALDFRKQFKRDVVIDMYCFRKHGHNESDEPEFTQPLMYRAIKQRASIYEEYLKQLKGMRGITPEEVEEIIQQRRSKLEVELEAAKDPNFKRHSEAPGLWEGYTGGDYVDADEPDTTLSADRLTDVLVKQTQFPQGFTLHPKLERLMDLRREMARGEKPMDWGAAEATAFGTLLFEGHPLRMTGQDVGRGTFSHRHAMVYDYKTGERYISLKNVVRHDAFLEMYNSPLSEAGVLGFEYGYSLDYPEALTIWEAQFGDFVNTAQVIIDQFIVSAEEKWKRLSGLVMLLPHGFEGQGPEHSSARLERFLLQAAEDNIQVIYPSTPAQYYHMLRRQVLRKWKKPLVVMTPKSLLRHKDVVSPLEDLANGHFQTVIPDKSIKDPKQVKKVLLCTGKIYYELLARREKLEEKKVPIIRVEQLYPLPEKRLKEVLEPYADGTEVYWVQEEPENMGASRFMKCHLGFKIFDRFPFKHICRHASASPATGSYKSHAIEQEEILTKALGPAN